jgi:hypothetical protein
VFKCVELREARCIAAATARFFSVAVLQPHHLPILFCITLASLQGWLSPVRPGEHYLATYISAIFILQIIDSQSVCDLCVSPRDSLTSLSRYASALWAVQATAAAQSGILAASYRVALLNQ